MKNKIVVATILTLLFTNGFSQKSIVKLQIGYGIAMPNTLISESSQTNTTSSTYTGVYGSYGSGLRLEGGYLRQLNANLSIELDGAYLIGKSINSSSTSQNNTEHLTSSSHFYEISPLLRVKLGGKKIKPYLAIGPVFGFGNFIADYITNNGGGTNGSEIQVKYHGSSSVGAKSVVGAEFNEGRFVFYAQITMIAMNYAPSKSEYTKYSLNGVDQLGNLTISQKQSVYKNSVSNASPDPNQPSEQLKFYAPFGSISLNAGVMFKF